MVQFNLKNKSSYLIYSRYKKTTITFPSITATQLFVVPKSIPTTAPEGPPLLKRHDADNSTGVCNFSKNLLAIGALTLTKDLELIASALEAAVRAGFINILNILTLTPDSLMILIKYSGSFYTSKSHAAYVN